MIIIFWSRDIDLGSLKRVVFVCDLEDFIFRSKSSQFMFVNLIRLVHIIFRSAIISSIFLLFYWF